MFKKILCIIILMLLAEPLSKIITIDFIVKVFYVILGLGFIYVLKEEFFND